MWKQGTYKKALCNIERKLSVLEQKPLPLPPPQKKKSKKKSKDRQACLYILSLTHCKCEKDIQASFATCYEGQIKKK